MNEQSKLSNRMEAGLPLWANMFRVEQIQQRLEQALPPVEKLIEHVTDERDLLPILGLMEALNAAKEKADAFHAKLARRSRSKFCSKGESIPPD